MADAILADVKSSGIYQIRNLENGKRYIGSAKCFKSRWHSHRYMLRRGLHHSRHLQSSWNNRGEAAFVFEIIELCPIAELLPREQRWIDADSPEYNVSPTASSPLGVKHSDEFKRAVSDRFRGKPLSQSHKDKIRETAKEQWLDPAVRQRMVDGLAGSYDDRLRRIRSKNSLALWSNPDHREAISRKIRESHTPERRASTSHGNSERWRDPAFRQRMILALSGREVTKEQREKIRTSLLGRKMSDDTKRKKSALTDDQVRQIRLLRSGGATHELLAESFSVSKVTVSRLLRGTRYGWVA